MNASKLTVMQLLRMLKETGTDPWQFKLLTMTKLNRNPEKLLAEDSAVELAINLQSPGSLPGRASDADWGKILERLRQDLARCTKEIEEGFSRNSDNL